MKEQALGLLKGMENGFDDMIVIKSVICRLLEERDKFIKVLEEIANDYPELSHDKARMQNLDHIKWAKEVLNERKRVV